ncbi:MAG: glycoside hydrolase family 18 protein [Ferruginibacter sp.]|nr:glycoside hydrolase family 18 protein [Chitinophagaceae bacterium]
MKQAVILVSGIILSVLFLSAIESGEKAKNRPVIIAYVGGFRGLADIDSLNPKKLSHINYAFVDVKDNMAWLHNEATDTVNFRRLTALKKQNKELKILISLGGWTWSKNFSDAVITDTSTHSFAYSCIDIVAKYDLDGVDIDWEYPGLIGDNNKFRPEDKQGYTLLFKELRQGLDSLKKITRKKYLVTTAVGAHQDFIDHTEMDLVQQYTDFINLMAYDYAGGWDTISGHHTNLYASSDDTSQSSTDKSVKAFIAAGVPPKKLVIGMGFYGKGWEMETRDNNGMYRRVTKSVRAGGFDYLKDSLENKNGFIKYWDDVAKAPYLFNPQTKVFITYDDERSIREKCVYIKKNYLAGAMFWEYEDDKKEYLLDVIAREFNY